MEYPADQAAVQFVVDVFESVVQVFGETAQAHSWSADVFRSSMESWCDGLTERAYRLNHTQSGVAHREPLEDFVARVQQALVAAPCWAQYQDVLHTLSTIQATPLSVGQQLSALMKEAKWSVNELAKAAHVDRTNVHDHLSDKVTLRSSTRQQDQEAFSVRLKRPVKLDG